MVTSQVVLMRNGQRETKTPTRARIARAFVVSAIGLTTADIFILGFLLTHEGHVLVVAGVRGALDDVKQASVGLVCCPLTPVCGQH